MVTYQLSVSWYCNFTTAGLVIGALFILPFLLFSATSGQLADKYDKKRLIRFVKRLEVGIMALAAWGFLGQRAHPAGLHLSDGVAFDAVWPRQIRLYAPGAVRA